MGCFFSYLIIFQRSKLDLFLKQYCKWCYYVNWQGFVFPDNIILCSFWQYCQYFNCHGYGCKSIKFICWSMGFQWFPFINSSWWKFFCSKRFLNLNLHIIGSNIFCNNNWFYYEYIRQFWSSWTNNAICYGLLNIYISG